MSDKNVVHTEAGYLSGIVTFSGLPMQASPPVVMVIAEQGPARASATSEGTGLRKKYLLVLPTGEWSVHAECGPVASSIQKISIRSGESIELDFEMGAKAA